MSRTLIISLGIIAALVIAGTVGFGLKSIARQSGGDTTPPGTSSAVVTSGAVQASDGGGVQVQVTFDPTSAWQGDAISFLVTMNTHSVELGAYDLGKLSLVIIDEGAPLTGAVWTPKGAADGHHVEGTLTVPDPARTVRAAKSIVLELEGLPGPGVRRFEWQVTGR